MKDCLIERGCQVNSFVHKGADFEKDVEQLLTLMGYRVSRNHLINGTQIDLLASKGDLLNNVSLVVECADREVAIGVDVVKQKASVLLSLQGGRFLYRLLFVAKNGFTAEAKAFAGSQPNLVLLTPSELENELIDFRPYAEWYLYNYENSTGSFKEGRLYEHYVELAAKDEEQRLIPSLTQEVKVWLEDRTNNLLFLLGEYGFGKTSFSRQLAYLMLKAKYRGDGDHKMIPVLINLRDYQRGFNIQQVVTDTLINQYGVSMSSFMAFERICGTGSVFMILDGFDEMADRSDKQTLIDCFSQIYVLAGLNTKILVTCRSNVFRSHSDLVALMGQFSINVRLPEQPGNEVAQISFAKHGRVLSVEKLNDSQVLQFIEKRFGSEAESVLTTIRGIHDLSDLATRPVLLDMILTTLPELTKEGKKVNSAALYEHYINRWTARDAWRVKTPLMVRQHFCDSLAWAMHSFDVQKFEFSYLEAVMVESLRDVAESEQELQQFKHEIQTCSFLVGPDSQDSFRFAHKSFVEFLSARKIIKQLASGSTVKKPTSDSNISTPGPKAGRARPKYALGAAVDLQVTEQGYPSRKPLFSQLYDQLNLRFSSQGMYATFDHSLALVNQSDTAKPATSTEEAIRAHLESQMAILFGRNNTSKQADRFGISEEIATFAVEHLSNEGLALEKLIAATREPEMIELLADILRLSKSTEYIRKNEAFAKEYAKAGDKDVMKVALCSAMSYVPGLITMASVRELRTSLTPGDWSYFLFEIATRSGNLQLINECSQLADLRPIDKVICAFGRGLATSNRKVHEDSTALSVEMIATSELLESNEVSEVSLGLSLCSVLGLPKHALGTAALRVLRRVNDKELKLEAASILERLDDENIWRTVRTAQFKETDAFTKSLLRDVEQRMRDATSRQKSQMGWEVGRVNQATRNRVWNRLRS